MSDNLLRSAQWGNWGIDYLGETVPGKNFRTIIASYSFPIGTRGPVDLPRREEYRRDVRGWIENGVIPAYATQRAAFADAAEAQRYAARIAADVARRATA